MSPSVGYGESLPPTPALGHSSALLIGILIAYCTYLAILRLFFSPAAKFPGPKLAALTYFYEFYYDVWQEGQYTWKLRDLHRQYGKGMLICISLGLSAPTTHRSIRPNQST